MAYYFNIFYIFLFIGSTILFASESKRKYEVPSAMIMYSIDGGGRLTNEANLTITGKGKLRFKEWGEVELFEETVEEIVSGAINNIEMTQVCEKINHKQKLNVDFKNKKILERQVLQNKNNGIADNFVRNGQEEVLGYKCDIFEKESVRKCLYKGIPLFEKYQVLGMHYQKRAVQITLDINSSLNQCTIPSYPIQKFTLFKTNIKTKNRKLSKSFLKRLFELSKVLPYTKENNNSEVNVTDKQKKVWLEKFGENIFEKQKQLLPKFLLSMKKARVCLQQADNWIEANTCLEEVIAIKTQFTKDKRNSIELWKGEAKQRVLDEFDTDISRLETKMTCIRSAKNITDLSSCLK